MLAKFGMTACSGSLSTGRDRSSISPPKNDPFFVKPRFSSLPLESEPFLPALGHTIIVLRLYFWM